MASIIKLKRSLTSASIPGSLQEGEIAVNLEDKKLFVGGKNGGANVQVLSGDLYNLSTSNGSDSAILTLTVDNDTLSNDAITFAAGEGIDISASASTITIAGELASDTNKGVASFNNTRFTVSSGAVDVATSGINTTQLADGSVTSAKIAAGGITSNAIGNDSVELGTKTTGNYVATVADAGNSRITVSGSGSESAAVTLDITNGGVDTAQLATNAVTTVKITDSNVTNAKLQNDHYTLSANSGSNFDAALGETLNIVSGTATGVTVALSANTITVSGVDASATVKGVAKFDSNDFTVSSGTVSLADSATGAVSTINATANETSVSRTNGTVTVGLADNVIIPNNLTVSGNTHIDGNLTVEGGVTYISSSTVNVDDSMLKLSANNAADTVDTGVYALYVDNVTSKYSGYFRDATDNVFKFYTGLQSEPTTVVNTAAVGYTLAQVDAVIDGGTY